MIAPPPSPPPTPLPTLSPATPAARRTVHMRGSFLVGCLSTLAVLLILFLVGSIYTYTHWKGWTAEGMRKVMTSLIDDSQLSEDQKTQIIVEIDALADEFKAGNVSLEELAEVAQELAESPLILMGTVQALKSHYVDSSDMNDEEKADAEQQLQRFTRGMYEDKIAEAKIDEVLQPLLKQPGDGEDVTVGMSITVNNRAWNFKESISREELDKFIENVRAASDEGSVPDEPYEIDIAQEITAAIDRALNRNAAQVTAEDPPATNQLPAGEPAQDEAEETASDNAGDGG